MEEFFKNLGRYKVSSVLNILGQIRSRGYTVYIWAFAAAERM